MWSELRHSNTSAPVARSPPWIQASLLDPQVRRVVGSLPGPDGLAADVDDQRASGRHEDVAAGRSACRPGPAGHFHDRGLEVRARAEVGKVGCPPVPGRRSLLLCSARCEHRACGCTAGGRAARPRSDVGMDGPARRRALAGWLTGPAGGGRRARGPRWTCRRTVCSRLPQADGTRRPAASCRGR